MPRDDATALATGKATIIVLASPLTIAREFRDRIYGDERHPTLLRHRGTFFRWVGPEWAEIGEEALRAEIYKFLEGCHRFKEKDLAPVQPNIRLVGEVFAALKAITFVDDEIDPPAWLEERRKEDPREIVAFKNGLLHLPARALIPPTPEFFCLSSLKIDWNLNAPKPEHWFAFLAQLWPEDQESISTLQKLFGYLLTDDTKLQIAVIIIGPPRSGKGTIGRVLGALVGTHNTVSPTLSSLASHFGRASLIGKRMALIGDAKVGRDTDPVAIAEHILGITGEDVVSIPRKYQADWTGRLRLKFVVLCTEVPGMTDDSAGIASRFIVLQLTTSFLGREDTSLTNKLLAELPGIAVWAVGGWDAVFGEKGTGKILQPTSALGHIADIRNLASDIKQYLDERCDFSPDYSVPRDLLYTDFCSWRSAQGRRIVTKAVFGRKLRTAFPKLGKYHPGESATSDHRPPREYRGLRLRP